MASGPQGFRTEPLARTTTGNNPLGQTADQPPSRFPTAGNPVGGPTTAGTTFSTQSPLGAGPSASLSPGGLDAGLNPPPGSPVNTPASSISRLPYNPGSVVPTPGIPTTPGPYPSTAIPPGPNP